MSERLWSSSLNRIILFAPSVPPDTAAARSAIRRAGRPPESDCRTDHENRSGNFYRLQPVFFGDLFAHFRELLFVPHHDAKMPHSVRLDLLDLEHCQELMLAELEKGITFALCQFLEIEGSW